MIDRFRIGFSIQLLIFLVSLYVGLHGIYKLIVSTASAPHWQHTCVDSVQRHKLTLIGEVWVYSTRNVCKKYRSECVVGAGYVGDLTCKDLYARGRL